MNMPKLGTVIQSKLALEYLQNPRKQRADGLMRYTLCEYQIRQSGLVQLQANVDHHHE